LRTRQRDEVIAPAYLAAIPIGLGRTDEARAALAEAYEQRSWYVSWWKFDPDLGPRRSDPRFTALVKKVDFQP
jgi:hypothetical protein